MSRFGDLLKTNEVHSAFEEETAVVPEPVVIVDETPVEDTEPYKQDFLADVDDQAAHHFVNPLDEMPVANGDSIPNFKKMSKFELEEYGRTVGIELDRRLSQKKLVKQLKEHIGR